MPKFGMCIFDQKYLIWVYLGKNFKNAMVVYEISSEKIPLISKFCEKTKIPELGTKNVVFGYFWARVLKNNRHI